MEEDPQSISLKDIWPQERDYMSRPERYKYVRKIVKPTTCVFCDVVKADIGFESLCLYKTDKTMVLINKYPYNSGHVLVIPQRHIGDLRELKADEKSDLDKVLHLTVKAIYEVYDCKGINIGMNHGQVAGAGIPDHLHWHVIPRWLGDTNFFPMIAETKCFPETLEQSYEKMQKFFETLK